MSAAMTYKAASAARSDDGRATSWTPSLPPHLNLDLPATCVIGRLAQETIQVEGDWRAAVGSGRNERR